MEIERKYAVKKIPGELSLFKSKKIEQGYLCHNPVLRIRKSNEDYYITYKSKFGIDKKTDAIVQNEVELPLTQEAYENLRKKTDHHMIEKTRYLIPLNDGRTAELDIFEGVLSGLCFVEVEFPDEQSADDFVPPEWFGKELTSDKRFSNYSLSKLNSFKELNMK